MSNSGRQWITFAKNNRYSSEHIGTKADEAWNGDFYFIQGADPQFGLMAAHQNSKKDVKDADWSEEIRLAKLAVEKVNQLNPKPRFFIICGDLTNEFPIGGCLETKEKQLKDFKNVFSQIRSDIPLICVCGNHDVGDAPTVDSINRYRSDFGDDYFSFWCSGVFFIVLNSQYLKNSTSVPQLAEEHEQWLDNQLKTVAGSRIICFSHIPLFINEFDEEEDKYFNIKPDIRFRILEKLYNAGVRNFFCGHYHRNAGGFYKEMELVVTSAIGLQLGSDKSGIRIVKVTQDNVCHKYYPLEDVPAFISMN